MTPKTQSTHSSFLHSCPQAWVNSSCANVSHQTGFLSLHRVAALVRCIMLLNDNKTSHKVCVCREQIASFKCIFMRKPWRHNPMPFAIPVTAEQQPACQFWRVLLTLCLENSWQCAGDRFNACKMPLKNVFYLRNTKPHGQQRGIYTEIWFLSYCKTSRECLNYCGMNSHAFV